MRVLLCCCVLFFGFCSPSFGAQEKPDVVYPLGYTVEGLEKLFQQVTRTGLGYHSIPDVSGPQFMSVADACLSMDDEEVVFIVLYPEGRIRVYPQRILVWHQVVNDILPDAFGNTNPHSAPGEAQSAGHTYSISYCPLTGTVVGFRSMAGRYASSFAVTGDLLNANSMLYDRISYSSWSQLLGLCIDGPLRGKRLDRIPVLWARWRGVREKYQDIAEVMARPPMRRAYGKDPYGSYSVKGTYYDDNRVLHPLSFLDTRLPPKKRILGLEQESLMGALQVDAVREERIVQFTMGVVPMVGIYDATLDAVRVFDRRLGGNENNVLDFMIFEDQFVDRQTKSQWSPEGVCTYGRYRGQSLIPVYAIDSMWFSWAAFYRNSQIYPPPAQVRK